MIPFRQKLENALKRNVRSQVIDEPRMQWAEPLSSLLGEEFDTNFTRVADESESPSRTSRYQTWTKMYPMFPTADGKTAVGLAISMRDDGNPFFARARATFSSKRDTTLMLNVDGAGSVPLTRSASTARAIVFDSLWYSSGLMTVSRNGLTGVHPIADPSMASGSVSTRVSLVPVCLSLYDADTGEDARPELYASDVFSWGPVDELFVSSDALLQLVSLARGLVGAEQRYFATVRALSPLSRFPEPTQFAITQNDLSTWYNGQPSNGERWWTKMPEDWIISDYVDYGLLSC